VHVLKADLPQPPQLRLRSLPDTLRGLGFDFYGRGYPLCMKSVGSHSWTHPKQFQQWFQFQSPPVVNVSVPEQPAPVVNVSVPSGAIEVKQLPSVVNLENPITIEAPPPRRVRKHISYENGMPVIIEEVEMDADNSENGTVFDDLQVKPE